MEQIPGQLSLFDQYVDTLGEIMKRGFMEGGRVRIYAALTYPAFQQYAEDFLRREYGAGGFSLSGGFVDFNGSGITYRQPPGWIPEHYTWKAALGKLRELIAAGDYLTREDEREIEAVIRARGRLPYPRAHCRYPECAWEDGPRGNPSTANGHRPGGDPSTASGHRPGGNPSTASGPPPHAVGRL